MKVMITQSNYIPWKGYFDAIHSVDLVVLYDDVQYTRRDWRNRNRIKTSQGAQWLTIPVEVKGKYHQTIEETRISEPRWGEKHFRAVEAGYRRAPHFEEVAALLSPLWQRPVSDLLSEVNLSFLSAVCGYLGIRTPFRWSREFSATGDRTGRLVDICRRVGATEYYSGPAARAYLEESLFREAGVGVHYFDYSGYREYPQLFDGFVHEVSIIDLLFNAGKGSSRYLKTFGA